MSKLKKSQILMLSLLAALLFVTPLLSSSLRPKYLYFIINLVIIALGAEAGLLSAAFAKPNLDDHNKKNYASPISAKAKTSPQESVASSPEPRCSEKKARVVQKSASEKIGSSGDSVNKLEKEVKKCPSMPSLFFIGSGDVEDAVQEHEQVKEEEEEEEDLNGQELFTKAEIFIGNFYQQLKMQREESWSKRIHEF